MWCIPFALLTATTSVHVATATVSMATVTAPVPIISSVTLTADRIEIDSKRKEAYATGNVIVKQASGTLTGTEAEYNWETSTGIVKNAHGISPPWGFSADRMDQVAAGRFYLYHGDITSCPNDPPHYHLASSKADVITGKRAKMTNTSFMADEVPIFWTPFYTRSLVPKKYTLRIEPGQTSRDGITNKTILGYPFTTNSVTKFRWDWLQRTGNGAGLEHQYFNPRIRGSFDSYYIRDTNPDPQPQSKRYSVLWNHYQQLTDPLTLNARVDFKSDQTFGNQFENVGNDVRVENQLRGLISEGGLSYQFKKATLQTQFNRRDRFDSSISSSNFISKLTLPRVIFNTIPMSSKYLPFYTSFSGTWVNETLDRTSPLQTLRYQRSATTGIQIRRDLKINRNLVVTPLAGYTQGWQDRDVTIVDSYKDVYQGRTSIGSNVRQRVGRNTNLNVNYNYATRLRRNQTLVDSAADDFGIESNLATTSVETWVGLNNRFTLSSGYDFRDPPRGLPSKYEHLSERISAPTLDAQWEPRRNVIVNFRETYGLFDSNIRNSVRTPVNTSGEIQLGQISKMTYFSQGFSYTKPSGEQDSVIIFTNKLKFFLTPRWYLDAFLSYRAVGKRNLEYKKVFPIERTLRVIRDMHCWVLRTEFSSRPGIKEVSFYIDMKANMNSTRNVFANPEDAFYGYREEPPDPSKIFPPESEKKP